MPGIQLALVVMDEVALRVLATRTLAVFVKLRLLGYLLATTRVVGSFLDTMATDLTAQHQFLTRESGYS